MTELASPILVHPIPDIEANEGDELPALNLLDFIQNPSPACGDIQFTITLSDGDPLPSGVEYTEEGLIYGFADEGTLREEAYNLLVIAKNDADVPLVTYVDLIVHEAPLVSEAAESLDEMVGQVAASAEPESDQVVGVKAAPEDDFWGQLDENIGDLFTGEESLEETFKFANKIDDPSYRILFVEYMLRKFSSLQFYNADYDGGLEFQALTIKEAKTGWPVYEDGDFAIATSNPKPYAKYVNRGLFVDTLKEMLGMVQEKGWKTVGVAGFDKKVGWKIVHEHNAKQALKPKDQQHIFACDDIFQDAAWVNDTIGRSEHGAS